MKFPQITMSAKEARFYLTVLFGGSLFFWGLSSIVSVMMFDAPGADKNTLLLWFAWVLWTYGGTTILILILSWVFPAKRKFNYMYALPALHGVAGFSLFFTVVGRCGGKLVC
jgi:hypothetical protein